MTGSFMSDREFLVSVVTPFHNARLDLFEKGVESLKEQTIGFENIGFASNGPRGRTFSIDEAVPTRNGAFASHFSRKRQ